MNTEINYAELKFNALKAEAAKLGINTQGMKKEAIIDACIEATTPVVVEHEGKGRPVNPNSKRQQRLREMEAKKASGYVGKKGRPIVEGSKNHLKKLEIAARIEQGIEIKRGRPTNLESARQKRLAKSAELRAAGGSQYLGRPVNPLSARQQKAARIAAMKEAGTFKLGRPAVKKVEAEVVTPAVETTAAETAK